MQPVKGTPQERLKTHKKKMADHIKDNLIGLMVDLSTETLKTRQTWQVWWVSSKSRVQFTVFKSLSQINNKYQKGMKWRWLQYNYSRDNFNTTLSSMHRSTGHKPEKRSGNTDLFKIGLEINRVDSLSQYLHLQWSLAINSLLFPVLGRRIHP